MVITFLSIDRIRKRNVDPENLRSAQLHTKTSSGCVWQLFLPSRVTVDPSKLIPNVANGRGEVGEKHYLYNECTGAEYGKASLTEHLHLNIYTFVLSSKQTINPPRWPTKFLQLSTQPTLQWLLLSTRLIPRSPLPFTLSTLLSTRSPPRPPPPFTLPTLLSTHRLLPHPATFPSIARFLLLLPPTSPRP